MKLLKQSSKWSLRSSASSPSSTSSSSSPQTPLPSPGLRSLSLEHELDLFPTSPSPNARVKTKQPTSTKARKEKRWDPLTPGEISDACQTTLLGPDGTRTTLGQLFQTSHRRIVVILIRHFWCGLCEEYTMALAQLSREKIKQGGVRVVVIGCGEPSLIDAYRRTTHLPAEYCLYADPTTRVHRAFGLMTSLDPGPAAEMGAYVKRSMLGNAIHSAVTGLKNPTRNPGPMSQLGGEFVFTTTRKCIYACRMTTTRDHGDLCDVFAAAGVDVRRAKGLEDELDLL